MCFSKSFTENKSSSNFQCKQFATIDISLPQPNYSAFANFQLIKKRDKANSLGFSYYAQHKQKSKRSSTKDSDSKKDKKQNDQISTSGSGKKGKKSNDHISSSDSGKLKVVWVGDGSCGKSSLIHHSMNDKRVRSWYVTGNRMIHV